MAFRDLPVRRKILTLVLVSAGCVLLLTWGILVTYDLLTMRRDLDRELTGIARVLAANSTAALAFRDDEAAREVLSALSGEQHITAAALYDSTGTLFANYATASPPPQTASALEASTNFTTGRLSVLMPVRQNEQVLGTLFLQTDLNRLYERSWLYLKIMLAVMAIALLLAATASRILRRGITGPIHELASAAKLVSERGDYNVRAKRLSNDELGELTDTFNRMLGQIQEREERIRESEDRLRIALAAADMGIWRFDPARKETTRDANLNRLFGLEPTTSTWPLSDFINRVYQEDRDYVRTSVDTAVRAQTDLSIEFRLVRTDGSIRWLRGRGGVLVKDGTLQYITGVAFDITDRKKDEEEIRRLNADLEQRVTQRTGELAHVNQELEAFTYTVSHDLRSPLRILSAFAEILTTEFSQTMPEEALAHAQRIVRGAGKMSALVDSLLNFSRLGRHPLTMQPTDLNLVIDDVLMDLTPDLMGRKVEWRRSPLPTVECDPSLMRQVFANLISNALKYSRPRDPAIIQIAVEEKEGRRFIIVRDNGVGFDMRHVGKLFVGFQRLHSAEEFEGSGIGLASVARILRKHNGSIFAESALNQGATFFIDLPGLSAPLPTSATATTAAPA